MRAAAQQAAPLIAALQLLRCRGGEEGARGRGELLVYLQNSLQAMRRAASVQSGAGEGSRSSSAAAWRICYTHNSTLLSIQVCTCMERQLLTFRHNVERDSVTTSRLKQYFDDEDIFIK